MLLPSKVTPYSESVLSKLPLFLRHLKTTNMTVLELFAAVRGDVVNAGEFIEILDCLYALRKIDLSQTTGTLHLIAEEDA